MALVYVGGTTGVLSNSTNASYNVSLTSLTGGVDTQPRTGDLVLVITGWSTSATNGDPGVTTSGFTNLATDLFSSDTRSTNADFAYKVMGAVPDTSITVSAGGSASYGNATAVHVWRGADALSPMDVAIVTNTGTNGSRADSSAIVPSTAGAVIISAGIGSGATSQTAMTAPTNFTNTQSAVGDGSTGDCVASIASYGSWSAGSYDPAAWTGGTTAAQDSWCSVTVALRPGPWRDVPAGTTTLAGAAPRALVPITITPAAGSLTAAGAAPTLIVYEIRVTFSEVQYEEGAAIVVTPDAGAVTASGSAPSVHRLLAPAAGAVAAAGAAPSVTSTLSRTPDAGTVTAAGAVPTLTLNATVQPAAGALTAAADVPIVNGSRTITPSAAAVAVTGYGPDGGASYLVRPDAANATLAAAVPNAGQSFTIRPDAGAVTAAGAAPTPSYSYRVSPAAGVLAAAGAAPYANYGIRVTWSEVAYEPAVDDTQIEPAAGVLMAAGAVPDVSVTTGTTTLIRPAAGALAAAGSAPTPSVTNPSYQIRVTWSEVAYGYTAVNSTITPAGATTSFSGTLPRQTYTLPSPNAAVLALVGRAPTVSVTSGTLLITPAGGVLTAAAAAPGAVATDTKSATPAAGAVAAAGATPTVTRTAHVTITPAAAAVAAATALPGVVLSRQDTLEPLPTDLQFTAFAPELSGSFLVQPAAGVLAAAGAAPTLGGSFVVTPSAGVVTAAGAAPLVGADFVMEPAGAATVIAGAEPTALLGEFIQPDAAAVLLGSDTPIVVTTLLRERTPQAARLLFSPRAPTVAITSAPGTTGGRGGGRRPRQHAALLRPAQIPGHRPDNHA